jgi:hypothetical protein
MGREKNYIEIQQKGLIKLIKLSFLGLVGNDSEEVLDELVVVEDVGVADEVELAVVHGLALLAYPPLALLEGVERDLWDKRVNKREKKGEKGENVLFHHHPDHQR